MRPALRTDLRLLNVCSEPWRVGDLHTELMGSPFANAGPPVIKENVCTEHADAFGRSGPYLHSRFDVLKDLRDFVGGEKS